MLELFLLGVVSAAAYEAYKHFKPAAAPSPVPAGIEPAPSPVPAGVVPAHPLAVPAGTPPGTLFPLPMPGGISSMPGTRTTPMALSPMGASQLPLTPAAKMAIAKKETAAANAQQLAMLKAQEAASVLPTAKNAAAFLASPGLSDLTYAYWKGVQDASKYTLKAAVAEQVKAPSAPTVKYFQGVIDAWRFGGVVAPPAKPGPLFNHLSQAQVNLFTLRALQHPELLNDAAYAFWYQKTAENPYFSKGAPGSLALGWG